MRFTNPAPSTNGPTVVSVNGVLDVPTQTMRAVIGTPPATQGWYVDRITVTSTIATTAYVYVGTISNANIADGTATGQLDTADYNVPLYVPPGSPLTVLWQTNTGTQTARVEYLAKAV